LVDTQEEFSYTYSIKKEILSIRNLSDASNLIILFIACRSATLGTGHKQDRFTKETFRAFYESNYRELIGKF